MRNNPHTSHQFDEVDPTTSRRRLRTAAGLGLTCLLLLTACGTQKADTGSGDALPLLHIGKSSEALGAPAAISSSVAGQWVFEGTAPQTPATGPVLQYDGTTVAEGQVVELATSLGLTAAPTKHAHGWEVTRNTSALRVRDTGEWEYARAAGPCSGVYLDIDSVDGNSGVACAGGAVSAASGSGTVTASGSTSAAPAGGVSGNATPDSSGIIPPQAPTTKPAEPTTTSPDAAISCGPAVDCVPAGPPVTCVGGPAIDCAPVSLPPAVPNAIALAAAQPVIKAAHLDGTPFVAAWGGSPATVLIDPNVVGLPTTGVQTSISVDERGIVNGYGRIGTPVELGQYPIVSVAEALKSLNEMPRPMMDIACPVETNINPSVSAAPVPLPGCGTPVPMVLSDVTFGLQLQWDGAKTILVPAWLFTPNGSTDSTGVIASIAVAPQYIAQPTPIPVPSMSDVPLPMPLPGSSGGGSGPASGSGGTATISAQTYTDNGDQTLTMHFWGGVCSTYSATAKESAADVVVFITDTPTNPDGVCPAMAQATDVIVKLSAPLGSRQVIDGPSGQVLSVGTAPK